MKFWFVPLIFFPILANGQELHLNLGRTFKFYMELESSLGSQRIDNKANHLLADDMAQPVTFLRTTGEFDPKPQVQYFFTRSDSVIQRISYEWDKQNFLEPDYEITEKDVESDSVLKRYVEKYKDLKNELKFVLGESSTRGSLAPVKNIDYLEVDIRDDWELDSLKVSMYMTFSNQFKAVGNMRITPTHRIRVTIQKTQKNVDGNLAEHFKKVFKADERQQEIAEKYVNYVVGKKYKKSWNLISPNIKEKIDFETYKLNVSRIEELLKDQSNVIKLINSRPNIIGKDVFYTYTFDFVNTEPSESKVLLFVTFKAGEYLVVDFTPRKL